MNVVRLRIVRTVKECGSNIRVAFSSDEIVRRIMKVSHSNDYKARSLTLLFLEALAPIIHSNKKVTNPSKNPPISISFRFTTCLSRASIARTKSS